MGDREELCYTTLALGYEYNRHAQQLAEDIAHFSPGVPFVVLTDDPQFFSQYQHVIAVKHAVQSVGIFHDKLCCIEASFKQFDCCLFLDADCRLLENLTVSRPWKPGITAKTCWGLSKKINLQSQLMNKKDQLTCEAIERLNLKIESCKFIYEAIFVVRKDQGKEVTFLQIWKQLRDYFEFYGMFDGEGIAMGLAASKAALEIHHYNSGYLEATVTYDIHDVFKDKLYYKFLKHNNSENLSDALQVKLLELEQQRKQIQNIPLVYKLRKRTLAPLKKKLRAFKLKLRSRQQRFFVGVDS